MCTTHAICKTSLDSLKYIPTYINTYTHSPTYTNKHFNFYSMSPWSECFVLISSFVNKAEKRMWFEVFLKNANRKSSSISIWNLIYTLNSTLTASEAYIGILHSGFRFWPFNVAIFWPIIIIVELLYGGKKGRSTVFFLRYLTYISIFGSGKIIFPKIALKFCFINIPHIYVCFILLFYFLFVCLFAFC